MAFLIWGKKKRKQRDADAEKRARMAFEIERELVVSGVPAIEGLSREQALAISCFSSPLLAESAFVELMADWLGLPHHHASQLILSLIDLDLVKRFSLGGAVSLGLTRRGVLARRASVREALANMGMGLLDQPPLALSLLPVPPQAQLGPAPQDLDSTSDPEAPSA